jgi:hypothetical protein
MFGIGYMAGKTLVAENRPDVAVEDDLFQCLRRQKNDYDGNND